MLAKVNRIRKILTNCGPKVHNAGGIEQLNFKVAQTTGWSLVDVVAAV